MTKIEITPNHYDVKPSGHYVYIHYRLSNMTVMYVGKGVGVRGFSHYGRNKYWNNVAIKHGVFVEIAQDGLSHENAMLLEMWLIAKFKYYGLSLCNLTDGGDGATGYVQSEETKELRASKMRGENHPFYGKTFSDDHIRKLSESHIGKFSGHDSPTAILDLVTFRHISGETFTGTRTEFKLKHGISSGGVARIINKSRKHEKGWYVSDYEIDSDIVLSRGLNSKRSDKNVYHLINDNGCIEFGTRIELVNRLGLSQSHLGSVVRGQRESHKGWRIIIVNN